MYNTESHPETYINAIEYVNT